MTYFDAQIAQIWPVRTPWNTVIFWHISSIFWALPYFLLSQNVPTTSNVFSAQPFMLFLQGFLVSWIWVLDILIATKYNCFYVLSATGTYIHTFWYVFLNLFLKHHFKKWYSQLQSNTTEFILASSFHIVTPFSSNNKFNYLFTPIILFCLILEYMN